MAYFCSNPWESIFIWGNGDVTHCCYSNIGPIGNIYKNSLRSIWNGKELKRIRKLMEKGDYVGAGCVYNCRPFRWNRLYTCEKTLPEIPEGLGRMPGYKMDHVTNEQPSILSVEIGGKCNLKCVHCLGSGSTKGIEFGKYLELLPYLSKAKFVRFMGSEFTANQEFAEHVKHIAAMPKQPTVFMVTNGQCNLGQAGDKIYSLKSFHLKFSIEGLELDFEKIRGQGSWKRFIENLLSAKRLFSEQVKKGFDRKIFLNLCVMKSNFNKIPEIAAFAADQGLPLVLNTINGMRHFQENFFNFKYLRPSDAEILDVVLKTELVMKEKKYAFVENVSGHLDYIVRAIKEEKPAIPLVMAEFICTRFKGIDADRLLYLFYCLKTDIRSFLLHLFRKTRKAALAFIRGRVNRKAMGKRT